MTRRSFAYRNVRGARGSNGWWWFSRALKTQVFVGRIVLRRRGAYKGRGIEQLCKAEGITFEELCARIDAKEAAAAEAWAVWKRERAARL